MKFLKVWIFHGNGDGNWCCGQLQNGETGWLPRSSVAPIDSLDRHAWYHGKISRIRAEIILNSGINGSFLVRESECDAEQAMLSIQFDERVYHHKISTNPKEELFIFADKRFATLAELVHHHSQHADGLVTTLNYPSPKSEKSTIYGPHILDEWEINRGEICVKQRINVGHYSDLYEGLLMIHQRKVAIRIRKVKYFRRTSVVLM